MEEQNKLTGLAYMLAQQEEPGGRVSENDITRLMNKLENPEMLNKLALKLLFPAIFISMLVFANLISVSDSLAEAESDEIPKALDLQKDGLLAQEKGIPVLLEFSMEGCPFCLEVEEEVLRPMLGSGEYENKVIVRNVKIDDDLEITDFNGETISYEDLASRYNIYVVPTLILVHGNGKEMGLEMVGVTTIDYYGTYLDQAIEKALNKVSTAAEPTSVGSPAS